jgi:glycine dehydrogenase subunit 2
MSTMNTVGRPTAPNQVQTKPATLTGGRGLLQNEALIFEGDGWGKTGVDLPEPKTDGSDLGDLTRKQPIGLPGLAEPETIRHYTRLSRQNYAIDLGLFPLGSCTMKHNPRLNERVARMPGFADVHPLQPVDTVQGALGVINELAVWLIKLTGMYGVAMSPKAGAHGELCGILCIKAALEKRGEGASQGRAGARIGARHQPGDRRLRGLHRRGYPRDARRPYRHRGIGSAAGAGRGGGDDHQSQHLRPVRTRSEAHLGRGACRWRLRLLRRRELQRHRRAGASGRSGRRCDAHQPAQDLLDAARRRRAGVWAGGAVRSAGAVRAAAVHRADGGRSYPADRGRDGGRRPSRHVRPDDRVPRPDGHVHPGVDLHPQHGADGLRQVAEDAVLNANYVLRSLEGTLDAPFAKAGPCMHEAIFSDANLAEGFSTLDVAKGLIDEGFHPMTVYFPLVVHGAMLVEPTETESKAALDQFIGALRSVAERAKAGD